MQYRNQYDSDVSIWSPQGRIHQIEYAMEAVKQVNNLPLLLVCIVTFTFHRVPTPPYLFSLYSPLTTSPYLSIFTEHLPLPLHLHLTILPLTTEHLPSPSSPHPPLTISPYLSISIFTSPYSPLATVLYASLDPRLRSIA